MRVTSNQTFKKKSNAYVYFFMIAMDYQYAFIDNLNMIMLVSTIF